MILFYGEGRLGNQVFQYQALCHIAKPDERVVAVGLEELSRTMELRGAKILVLTRNGWVKRLVKYAVTPLMLRPLARHLRLVNYVTETEYESPPNCGAGGEIAMRMGLVRRVTFVDGGHYQNSGLWGTLFPAELLRIRAALRAAAKDFLASLGASKSRPAFVHVRRGDYLTHEDYGLKNFSLPVGFYRRAMCEYENRVGRTHFVFVTDDPEWVGNNFSDLSNKTIASFDAAKDFAIMTECGGGILSNSTFSLAAAFMLDKPKLVIAPEFWFGFRVAKWLPPRVRATHDRILYLPVLPEPLAS
jgi:hypothetical protein